MTAVIASRGASTFENMFEACFWTTVAVGQVNGKMVEQLEEVRPTRVAGGKSSNR